MVLRGRRRRGGAGERDRGRPPARLVTHSGSAHRAGWSGGWWPRTAGRPSPRRRASRYAAVPAAEAVAREPSGRAG